MTPLKPNESAERSFGSIFGELTHGLRNLVRSEIHLAKAEMRQSYQEIPRQAAMIASFIVISLLGLLPFVAFMVIGLGQLLDDNYWLSSLIVSAVFLVGGGLFAYRSYRRIVKTDMTLPGTRQSLAMERGSLDRKVHEISEATRGEVQRTIHERSRRRAP